MDVIWIAVLILLGLSRLDERFFWISIGGICCKIATDWLVVLHGLAISTHPPSSDCDTISPEAVANTKAEICLTQELNKARQLYILVSM